MASKQRSRTPRKARAPNPLADLGIFDVPDLNAMGDANESDVDESDLESELEAILSGKAPSKPARPKKKVLSMDIEAMAAECMKNIDDEDEDMDDENLTDPDLLKELQGLSFENPDEESVLEAMSNEKDNDVEVPAVPMHGEKPAAKSIITLLEERLTLYNEAVLAAKALKDNSKVRRYGRAVKTLQELLKTAKLGKSISEEDIPPVVNIPKARAPTEPVSRPEPNSEASVPIIDNVPTRNLIDISPSETKKTESHTEEMISPDCKDLMKRRLEYKCAALEAKRTGDKTTALKYMKISKNIDVVIEAMKNGEEVDLTNIPPPPPPYEANITFMPEGPKKEQDETQTSSAIEAAALSAASGPEDPALFAAPPAPTSVLEALEQRREKYKSTKAAAEAEGNSSKVRRLERIIKSYEKAVKDWQKGVVVDFEELPTPPGFGPIPVPKESQKPGVSSSSMTKETEVENKAHPKAPAVPQKRPAPEVPSKKTQSPKPKVQRTNTSTMQKQLDFLLERQKLFRQAALASKKNGDIEQAKNYLRLSKGFDSMIQATEAGLPIDGSSIPTPPQLEAASDFVVVDISECVEDDGSSFELLETLENDLTKQIEVCLRNKEHFMKLGDVSSASKFEKLGLESKKDLSVIRHLKKTGQSPPKFHYETRLFSIVQCNTDLSDNELEVTVQRGINLPGKSLELDSFIKITLPIPNADTPQRAKTCIVKDSNNPIFEEQFKFEFNRHSRATLRQFKRGILKLEAWSKGGFLRSDTLLGTANVKLEGLESKCSIHDSFDLMDGRKACGGSLEVKVRIRHPLLVKQVEEVREKWLVIGS